ncbi:MAG: ATP-binding protein [Rhodospirillaceae bacterium]|nr:ATP-binding protein [Rhodospirillaceae bacterium]
MTRKKSSKTSTAHPLHAVLTRIADELARLGPAKAKTASPAGADAFVWHPDRGDLSPVAAVNRIPLALLKGIGRQAETLLANTRRHAQGLPANNALLWGARGTGKSSLVKAVHAAVNAERPAKQKLGLVEIHREDIPTLPALLAQLRTSPRKFILLCDDLSFEAQDTSYKALKSVLEGGIEGRPENVVFYATSNRRHLMARDMIENERATAIHGDEAIQEKVSLSDRFGLWLGFHNIDQDTYLDMIASYAAALKLPMSPADLRVRAIEWQMTRGGRSGRVAWQFIQDVAGELGVKISL